ncbi:D-hexose-6-phosphate mutarotase [Xylophilus sp. Kf1]|nr:D-hexose-6-phosphate mutarotase [Xylophilus sp. Kf1]
MAIEAVTFRGQDCLALNLPEGDRAIVALQGAQVLSWTTADGVERLYLSPQAVLDGRSAIRGGVPVCFPQFNQRGPLPKHGFARNRTWEAVSAASGPDRAVLALRDDDESRLLWPHAFNARLEVALAPGSLTVAFTVENTGAEPLEFTLALHSYLRIADIDSTRLHGLGSLPFWDAVHDTEPEPLAPGEPLRFDGETDRVYQAAAAPLVMDDGQGRLSIAQDPVFGQTVVWNPGAALSARLADMPGDGYRHMLCVEAAEVDTPVRLAAGETWSGAQRLVVRA